MKIHTFVAALFVFSSCLIGCAGPSSPFGAIEIGSGDGKPAHFVTENTGPNAPQVSFTPKRQVLHEAANVTVDVQVPTRKPAFFDFSQVQVTKPVPVDMRVVYDGRDVTRSFNRRVKRVVESSTETKFIYKKVKLTPDENHNVEFFVRTGHDAKYIEYSYLPPVCELFSPLQVKTTKPYSPKPEYLHDIALDAQKYKLNPNLMAAIIAQESGFHSHAKNWINAVGLSQITPEAADEIEQLRPQWKAQRLAKTKDWRLNPARSIEGEALYLRYLSDYWSDPDAQKIAADHHASDLSSIVLASYHAGAARVKKQISDDDGRWLEEPNMKHTLSYVNRVSSLCYAFSGGAD